MIDGVGIGIVEISRIGRAVAGRPESIRRWFTGEEWDRACSRVRKVEDLASRYACKQAVRNALDRHRCYGARILLSNIITSNDSLGKPLAALTGEAATRAGIEPGSTREIQVSITNSRDWAAAVAVFCRDTAAGSSGEEHL